MLECEGSERAASSFHKRLPARRVSPFVLSSFKSFSQSNLMKTVYRLTGLSRFCFVWLQSFSVLLFVSRTTELSSTELQLSIWADFLWCSSCSGPFLTQLLVLMRWCSSLSFHTKLHDLWLKLEQTVNLEDQFQVNKVSNIILFVSSFTYNVCLKRGPMRSTGRDVAYFGSVFRLLVMNELMYYDLKGCRFLLMSRRHMNTYCVWCKAAAVFLSVPAWARWFCDFYCCVFFIVTIF